MHVSWLMALGITALGQILAATYNSRFWIRSKVVEVSSMGMGGYNVEELVSNFRLSFEQRTESDIYTSIIM